MPARLAVLAGLLLAAQGVELWRVRWSPKPFVPTRADRAAGDRLIARLRSAPGDVFVPFHPWYARLAGKPGHIHRMGLLDAAFRPPLEQKRKPVRPEAQRVAGLAESFAKKRWAMIVLDDKAQLHELPGLEATYRLAEKLPGNERPRVFTGAHTTPATIWLPSGTSPGTASPPRSAP